MHYQEVEKPLELATASILSPTTTIARIANSFSQAELR